MKHFNENQHISKLTYPKKLNFFYQILTHCFKNKHILQKDYHFQ